MHKWMMLMKFIGLSMIFGSIAMLTYVVIEAIIWTFRELGDCNGSSPCDERQGSNEKEADPQLDAERKEALGGNRSPRQSEQTFRDDRPERQLALTDDDRQVDPKKCAWLIGRGDEGSCQEVAPTVHFFYGIGSDQKAPASRHLCWNHHREILKILQRRIDKLLGGRHDAPKI